jgi:DNA-binding transcriptional LysR family regulator
MAELRHYRYFVEITRRGTFTAAAEALNMTQSSLSEQILQFERECGSPLFNRGHSGVTLTPAGEYLLPQAESLLAKAAETREGLAGFRSGYQDRLRVSSVLGPLQSWLPAALAQFVHVRPHVQLQVHHNHSVKEILTGVAGDHLDVGVVSLRPSAPARSRHEVLAERILLEEELVMLAPPGHSLAQLAHVTPRDLVGRAAPASQMPQILTSVTRSARAGRRSDRKRASAPRRPGSRRPRPPAGGARRPLCGSRSPPRRPPPAGPGDEAAQ